MKAVVQRVKSAEVVVDGRTIGSIDRGMVVLLGVMSDDDAKRADRLAEKIARFRFFPDEDGRMNLAITEVGGEALVVSQVTLAADGRKGRRPSLDRAARGAQAEELYERFVERLRAAGIGVATGRFGAMMEVGLVNDGPVTFVLEEEG